MTPEEKAREIMFDHTFEGGQECGFADFVSSVDDMSDAIAQALREARNEALREAAGVVRKESFEWERDGNTTGVCACAIIQLAIEALQSDVAEPNKVP